MRRRTLPLWIAVGLGLLAAPVHARGDWRALSARLGELLERELGLTRQAAELERAVATLEREQAGAEYSAAVLDHAGRESVRRLDAYRRGRHEREAVTRQRARTLVKVARGGIARLAFEDVGEEEQISAQRVSRGRDLRWLVRRDLKELVAYQRAERRAQAELLHATRQLQALSVLATVHGMQQELLATAQLAVNPALQRTTKARRRLLTKAPAGTRARAAHRDRLAQLSANWKELEALKGLGDRATLTRPVGGTVVGRFGDYQDPVLRLPMSRNGVELAARPDEAVRSLADGRVVMVAELPGFEQVVVVDHGHGELSMLGRLWKVTAAEGDEISAGEVLAHVAPKALDDGLGTTVYVELRHGDKPVDPTRLLRRARRRRRP